MCHNTGLWDSNIDAMDILMIIRILYTMYVHLLYIYTDSCLEDVEEQIFLQQIQM